MALRIGTVNVQLFTDVQRKAASGDVVGAAGALAAYYVALGPYGDLADVDQRQQGIADRLADRILDAPYDIVCFQEMWSLPAWFQLKSRLLAGGYVMAWGSLELGHNLPWAAGSHWEDRDRVDEVLASWSGPVGSGVAIASRIPPLPFLLPGDTTARDYAFLRYSIAGGADGLAAKGAFVFLAGVPGLGRTVVATTHLQADYSTDGKPAYDAIRAKQLAELEDLLRKVQVAGRTTPVVLCGDLNVRAEPIPGAIPPRTPEYVRVFGWPGTPPANPLGALVNDGWTDSSPDEAAITNEDKQRLDIVAVNGRGTVVPRAAVVRHIMLARNLHTGSGAELVATPLGRGALPARGGPRWESDHDGVNAIVGRPAPNGTPSEAHRLPLVPGQAAAWGTPVDDGAPRWLLLPEPGTYTVELKTNGAGDARLLVFEPHDLSAPFAWLDPGGTPPPPTPVTSEFPGREVERHRVGGPQTPLYLRVQGESDTSVTATVIAYRYAGITPEEAIVIDPDVDHRIDVPMNQDDVWVELQPDGPPYKPTVSQTVTIDLHGDVVAVDVVDPALAPLPGVTVLPAPFAGTRTQLVLRGPQRVLLRVQTRTPQGKVVAHWSTDLKVLHAGTYEGTLIPGSWDLKFHCDDETGADWTGADEISVDGTADDLPLPHIYDGDSDTGENTDMSTMAPARFVNQCQVFITEDDPDDEATNNMLFPDELPQPIPARSMKRPLSVGSGQYTLFYNLSGWLRRQNL